jgi:hypothetical protein
MGIRKEERLAARRIAKRTVEKQEEPGYSTVVNSPALGSK